MKSKPLAKRRKSACFRVAHAPVQRGSRLFRQPQTAAFYEGLFGITRSKHSQGAVVFLKLDGLVLSLYPIGALAEDAGLKNDAGNFRGFSLAHNCASEAAVDTVFHQAVQLGGHAVKRPEKAFWGGYSGYGADPSGNLVEFAHNPYFPFSASGALDI